MVASKNTKYIVLIATVVVVLLAFFWSGRTIASLRNECEVYRRNTENLLTDAKFYRTKDSLSAARIETLELTAKEYERLRAQDAILIKSLKQKNRDLSAVNKTQFETIIGLTSIPKDTVLILRDSAVTKAYKVHCGDSWYDFDGIFTPEFFSGTLQNRDSLIVAETIVYKRFLGFLWKTKKIQSRQVDVLSKNPHTEIKGVEHILISQ